MASQRTVIALVALGAAVGALAGSMAGAGAALLAAVAGGLVGLAALRGAVFAAIRGACLGAAFITFVGPVADWLISGTPPTTNVYLAVVSGSLIGAALGIRNAPKRKANKAATEPGPSWSENGP